MKKDSPSETETSKTPGERKKEIMKDEKRKSGEVKTEETMRDDSEKVIVLKKIPTSHQMPETRKRLSPSKKGQGKKRISAESGKHKEKEDDRKKGKKGDSTETAKGSNEKSKKRNESKEKSKNKLSVERTGIELKSKEKMSNERNPRRSSEIEIEIESTDLEDILQSAQQTLHRPKKTKIAVGNDNRIEPEPWKMRDWKDIASVLAIFAVLQDPSQSSVLVSYAGKGGGLWYILLFIIVVTVIQLPLLFLFVHIGQYHRAGTLKVFTLYGPIYKTIGICSLLMIPFRHGIDTYDLAANLISATDDTNFSQLISCVDNPYSCHGEYVNRDTCCYSLYDKIQCSEMADPPHWCGHSNISSNRISAAIYSANGWDAMIRSNQWVPVACVSIVMVVGLAASFVPAFAFTAIVALFGIFGFILFSLVKTTMLLSAGDFTVGFGRMCERTLINNAFTLEALLMVTNLILWTGPAKLSVISVASMISPRKRMYLPIVIMHVIHVSITLFNFLGDISVAGFLESMAAKYGESSTSAAATGQAHLDQAVLPEFMVLSGSESWLPIFFAGALIVQVGPFCGPFFDVLAATLNQDEPRRLLKISGCCLVMAVECLALSVIIFFPGASGPLDVMTTKMFSLLIILVVECTIVIYGFNEHVVDVCALYYLKAKMNWFGPTSAFHYHCLRRIVQPILALCILLNFSRMASIESDSLLTNWISYGTGTLLGATFFICVIWDLIWMYQKQYPIKRAFLPQKGHKAYYRFFKGQDDVMEENKFDVNGSNAPATTNTEAPMTSNKPASSETSTNPLNSSRTEMLVTVE